MFFRNAPQAINKVVIGLLYAIEDLVGRVERLDAILTDVAGLYKG